MKPKKVKHQVSDAFYDKDLPKKIYKPAVPSELKNGLPGHDFVIHC